jgi:hypothetical protein
MTVPASADVDAQRDFAEASARQTAELSDLVGELFELRAAVGNTPPDFAGLHSCLDELDDLLAKFQRNGR